MKTLFVLALLICLAAAYKSTWHKKYTCKYGGLHPYPYNCRKYIQCVHGYPKLMPCPPGLVWNNCLKRCDWYIRKSRYYKPKYYKPKYYKGKYYKPKYYTRSYYNKCIHCNSCKHGKFRPYRKNCNKYIQCVHGYPKLMRCPPGLVWNNCLKRCGWYIRKSRYYKPKYYKPKYYKGKYYKPIYYKPTYYNKCIHCNSCKHGKFRPYRKNCNKYIRCVHGYPKLMRCPAGLVWNNCLKTCDWYKGKYYTRRYYKKCMRCYYKGKYYGK